MQVLLLWTLCNICVYGAMFQKLHLFLSPGKTGNVLEGQYVAYSQTGYNDISLCNTSSTTADILWHQLIPHC